jgi:hypothetical protein
MDIDLQDRALLGLQIEVIIGRCVEDYKNRCYKLVKDDLGKSDYYWIPVVKAKEEIIELIKNYQ